MPVTIDKHDVKKKKENMKKSFIQKRKRIEARDGTG